METKNTIGAKIFALIEFYKMNPYQFGKEIGLKDGSIVSKIIKGENKPSIKTVNRILTRFPEVNKEWILGDDDNMFKGRTQVMRMSGVEAREIRERSKLGILEFADAIGVAHKSIYNNEERDLVSKSYEKRIKKYMASEGIPVKSLQVHEEEPEEYHKRVPLYAISAAASPDVAVYDSEHQGIVGHVYVTGLTEQSDGGIRVAGNSMSKKYPSGSIIILKLITEWKDVFEPGLAYVFETDEQRMFKYLLRDESNQDNFIAVSENKNYQDFTVPKKSIRRLWKVLGCIEQNSLG